MQPITSIFKPKYAFWNSIIILRFWIIIIVSHLLIIFILLIMTLILLKLYSTLVEQPRNLSIIITLLCCAFAGIQLIILPYSSKKHNIVEGVSWALIALCSLAINSKIVSNNSDVVGGVLMAFGFSGVIALIIASKV